MNQKRIIITGAPGTGKSSLLELIQSKGYLTIEEAARVIIKQELASKSNIVPWINLLAFSEKVLALQLEQFDLANQSLTFYDRGMPDVFAYLNANNIPPTEWMEEIIHKHPYHPQVFITPPWKEIYANDEERKESFEQASEIHEHLVKIYQELGYELIEIPKLEVSKRLAFVLEKLQPY